MEYQKLLTMKEASHEKNRTDMPINEIPHAEKQKVWVESLEAYI